MHIMHGNVNAEKRLVHSCLFIHSINHHPDHQQITVPQCATVVTAGIAFEKFSVKYPCHTNIRQPRHAERTLTPHLTMFGNRLYRMFFFLVFFL